MRNFQIFIYNVAIYSYYFGILFTSLFNKKAALWVNGRKQNIEKIESKNIWFHVASLGEFEQAKPLIKKLKKTYPEFKIVLTFFSPSGYEVQKNNTLADLVYYFPLDTQKNAQEFIKKIKPKMVFFIKYEFWFHYLNQLKKHKIPTFLVAGIFRENQIFFKQLNTIFKEMLFNFTHFFVQNALSKKLLKNIDIKNVSIVEDTRFDTVFNNFENAKTFKEIESFIGNEKCVVIGSSWLKDELIWSKIIPNYPKYKFIIAPHEVNKTRIDELKSTFKNCALHSEIENNKATQVLIIDSIGKLSSLYQYSHISYVGGGFNVSVHNILEPAIFGAPIIFGPNHKKSQEALDLIQLGSAFEIADEKSLHKTFKNLNDLDKNRTCIEINKTYVKQRIGGSNKIILHLIEHGFLEKKQSNTIL